MIWSDTDIDIPVVVVRATYFAATTMMTGAIVFRTAVAEPALRSQRKTSTTVSLQILRLAWISLPVAVISGAIWVALLAESLSDQSFRETVMSGALRDVLTLTQFGTVTQIRFVAAFVLAIGLACDRFRWGRRFALAAALCLTASIAWTGHAASTPHALGYVHLASDVLHLFAASVWVGGLLALALFFHAGKRDRLLDGPSLELEAARRFSFLGIVSVATLIASGSINAWILVGSVRGLILTAYGSILMVKLAVFAIMLAFAVVNRLFLTPRLVSPAGSVAQCQALRRLTRNTIVEIALGLLVFALVGVLGTLHPAAHLLH